VDVGRHVLRLGQDELPVREAPKASVLTRSRPTESHRKWRRYVGVAVALVISGESAHGKLPRMWPTNET
jgi:hypothetical protein